MKNFHCTYYGADDAQLWRGGAPKSKADLQKLYAMGIDLIINLETGTADALGDYPHECQDWLEMGRKFLLIQCSNFSPPTAEQTKNVLNAITSHVYNGKKVYIHCFSGVDRTGWMCAAFRQQFWPAAEAWQKEAWEKGTHKWFFWWKWFFLSRY